LVGDDFRPLVGRDPDGPAYGNLLVSRLPLAAVEHLRFPPAGGGEQRTAILGSIQVGSRSVTVAATHLSNPTQQLDHILRNDPAGAVRPRGARVAAAPVSDHRALVVELDITAS
jgi:endonuclease/exonuclease/phosphatase family metal-dependent hydrolase